MSAESDMLQVVKLIGGIADPEAIQIAVLDVHGRSRERIFTDGLDASGAKIGSYSTEPIYVSPATSPGRKFAPRGKTGRTKFADGRPHVTRYFADGYKGFRAAAGRQNSTVDLRLSGTLRDSWLPERRGPRQWVLGFLNDTEAGKAAGNEKRFGTTIFELTDAEQKKLAELIAK